MCARPFDPPWHLEGEAPSSSSFLPRVALHFATRIHFATLRRLPDPSAGRFLCRQEWLIRKKQFVFHRRRGRGMAGAVASVKEVVMDRLSLVLALSMLGLSLSLSALALIG